MPAGMARAIEYGSRESTLEGQSYEWKAVLSGTFGQPMTGPASVSTLIASGDGEFSRSGTTLTFETDDIIEIENTADGVSELHVEEFALYVRIGTTDYVAVPTVNMNVTLQPFQVLRITEITLEVND